MQQVAAWKDAVIHIHRNTFTLNSKSLHNETVSCKTEPSQYNIIPRQLMGQIALLVIFTKTQVDKLTKTESFRSLTFEFEEKTPIEMYSILSEQKLEFNDKK